LSNPTDVTPSSAFSVISPAYASSPYTPETTTSVKTRLGVRVEEQGRGHWLPPRAFAEMRVVAGNIISTAARAGAI